MKKPYSSYDIREIYQDTYAIRDNGFGVGDVYMYLLVGEEKALLIDSGYGLLDLKEIIGSITQKPVICACTHGHLDHALGAWQFEQAYLHSSDIPVYQRHSDPELLRRIGRDGIAMKPSAKILGDPEYTALVERLANTKYPKLKALEEVSAFDLGDRTVEWCLLPGHTQGSVAFLDRKYSAVFDGDGAPRGVWLFLEESSSLADYIRQMGVYADYLRENGIARRFPGHQSDPLTVEDVDCLALCAQKALERPRKGWKIKTSFGEARIVFSNQTALFAKRNG